MAGRRQRLVEEKQRQDQTEVQQHGRGGGGGKAAKRVQDAGQQRNQADQHQVGESKSGERHREIELFRLVGKARRQPQHHPWHGDLRHGGEEHQHHHQQAEGRVGEGEGIGAPTPLHQAGEDRHEARVEGALGEQAAEEVRQLEGDEKGIGDRPRAQHGRHQDVADQAEHAARHGVATDRRGESSERHGLK